MRRHNREARLPGAIAVVLGLAVALALAARPAFGQEPDAAAVAKKHFDAGTSLLEQQDFGAAAVEFEASLAAQPTRSALFNLANCLQVLGRYAEALAAFARLTSEFGDKIGADMAAAAARHVQEIRGLVAEVAITSEPAGAEITVDGSPRGTTPLAEPLLLGPGDHEIRLALAGHDPAARKVRLIAGEKRSEAFALERTRTFVTVKSNVAGAEVFIDGESMGETPLAKPLTIEPGEHFVKLSKGGYEDAEKPIVVDAGEKIVLDFPLARLPQAAPAPAAPAPRKPSALFWTGLGLTLAAGITAGGLWAGADARYDEFKSLDDKVKSGEILAGDPRIDDRDAAKDDVSLYSKLAIGFGLAAGVLAAASAVVLVLDLKAESADDRAEVTAAPGGVSVRF